MKKKVYVEGKNKFKQAGAKLGQAQVKLELEVCFPSFEICFIKRVR